MIGLIFGETDFPKKILNKVKKKRIKYSIIDLTKKIVLKKISTLIMFQLDNLEKLSIF